MTTLKEKESNMGTPGGTQAEATQYERKTCQICGGSIPLNSDGKMRLHRQRDHHLYGVPGALVPYCPASRSRLHSGIDRRL
jgi:hypothetical protein